MPPTSSTTGSSEAPAAGSVTVVVTRTVRAGREAEYEQWLHGVGEAAGRFPGHLGLTILRPRAGARDYHLVFRFDSEEHLRAWETSSARDAWVEKANALCEETHRAQASGIEAWFALPDSGPRPPPRWKMALVSWMVAFPTIQLLDATLGPWLSPLPRLARGAAIGAAMIVLMTYAAMPAVTRLLARWLFPKRPRA